MIYSYKYVRKLKKEIDIKRNCSPGDKYYKY